MSERFAELEEVTGVRGLLALARADGSLVYNSSSLDRSACARAAALLCRDLDAAPAAIAHLSVNLEGGGILVYFIRDQVLVLHAGSDLDAVALRSRIRGLLAPRPEAVAPAPAQEGEGSVLTGQEATLMEAVMLALGKTAVEELGVFVAVKTLRETREACRREHRCINSITVGKDSNIAFQRLPGCTLEEANTAFANWAVAFFRRCNEIVPIFPLELAVTLLEHLRPHLDKIGFFQEWQRVVKDRNKAGP